MLSPIVYVVTPKPSLLLLLAGTEGVLADRFAFSADRPDRTDWTAHDYSEQAKLAFLMHMKSRYPEAPDVRLLLGGSLDATRFDEHWTLEPLEMDETLPAMTQALSPEVIRQATSSVLPVREWLTRLHSQHPAP